MKIKKLWIVLVVIIFICICGNVYAATKDVTAPVLKSISLKENKTYSIGDKVYLNIDANDDISGISYMYVYLSSIEWDEDTTGSCGGDEYIYDFDSNPYIIISDCVGNGKYKLGDIRIADNAGNSVVYTNDSGSNNKYLNYNIHFQVRTENNDLIAPSIENVSINNTSLKSGDQAIVSVKASDDNSGIKSIFMWFRNSVYSYDVPLKLYYDENSNSYLGYLSSPPYDGEYVLDSISIIDNAGNENYYVTNKEHTKEFDSNINWLYVEPIEFNVTGALNEKPNIQISKINYKYKKIYAPNIYKLSLEVSDYNDLVYNAKVLIALKKDENKSFDISLDKYIETYLYKDENNKLSGYVDIDQFSDNGVYYLADIRFNDNEYDLSNDQFNGEISSYLSFDNVDLFEIVDNDMYDIITSTTDKDLINKIKNAKNNAKIAINSTGDSVIKKEVFEAIKDTNKTIYIESSGIQWIFKGKDIKLVKDIDTNVQFNYLYNDIINEKVNNIVDNALVVNFSDNGKLPGKTLIRVKTDYALRNYLGMDNLFVYHYDDSQDKSFNRVVNSINMTEDGFFEFYIDHNSSFIISDKEVDSNYISDSIDQLALNDSSIVVDSNTNTNNFYYIIAGVVIVILLIIVIVVIKKKMEKKK